jgi:hypothetical protein
MLEKSIEQVSSMMFGEQRMGDLSGQIIHIVGDEVGHLVIFGVSPSMVHDVEFGHVCLEGLHVHPMPTEAVPDQQQGPLEMTSQLLDKGKDIVTGDVAGKHREIAA